MSKFAHPRRWLPILLPLVFVMFVAKVLSERLSGMRWQDIEASLLALPVPMLLASVMMVAAIYTALAYCEARIAQYLNGPVSARRAALTALIAFPIGHAVGWGAVSGGALRYRLYSQAGMRPFEVAKMILLSSIAYPAGLGLLLGLSFMAQSEGAATVLHTSADLARGTGIALLGLHLLYLTLVMTRREPVYLGKMTITLPTPELTTVQYFTGIVDVCLGAGILYALLPANLGVSFVVFIGIYGLCIVAGLASSIPAGLGVFESVLLILLPTIPKADLIASVLGYRFILELIPFITALLLWFFYEIWWRLPRQRLRAERIESQFDSERDY
jgi:uncharacterized membrane protein YbhN (UPF0104 family)